MSLEIGFTAQAPSLPGTGGGLGGLGETFAPDLSMGTGTLSVPLDLPNGPNDIGPKLLLRYDSGGPNGPFGLGWALPLPRLLRSTTAGRPRYSDEDTLVLEGSGPLVRLPDGSLRPEVETGEWRVAEADDGFVVTDRSGTRYELGTTADSRVPGLGGAAWSWLLHRIVDNLGTTAELTWRASGPQRYLEKVAYGPFEIAFTYEPRPDPLRTGRGGFLLVTDERCTSIDLRIPADAEPLVRRWTLGYTQAEPNGASVLASVGLTGRAADGSELAAPPLRLAYAAPRPATLQRLGVEDDGALPPALHGARGSGRVDLVDWDGDGLPDVIEFGAGGRARVWLNQAGSWARPVTAGLVPHLAGPAARAGLLDVDGDGIADVVRVDRPFEGYQPRTQSGFGRPVSWSSAPAVTAAAPTCRLVDLDGDGVPDLVWSTGTALLLAHRVDEGWSPRPDVVPAAADGPPTDLADPHVHCADMTGDGTPDVVRVDGRGVTYWPYLGAGVFGAAVRMAAPPVLPSDVDPARVLLVDLDGDGCADVVHLAPGRVRWWPNRAGSGFEPPRDIPHVPTGAMTDVRVADVLGTGTPALCWTAELPNGRGRWFALDPLGGARCGLLTSIDNGVGRHTGIAYSTSAREAARDRAAGRPWPTRLPIVLPVVGEVVVTDQVSGSATTTRYRYHDGRFDGVLREVCGFGEVETAEVGDADVATLVTTRWFHTGTLADGTEPPTAAQRRRARAVRGRIRRVERRAEDGTLFDTAESDWAVGDGSGGATAVPRLARTTRTGFEGAPTPVSRVVTEQLAWDEDGNVTHGRERVFEGSAPTPAAELVTRTEYAADPAGRFRQRVWRVRQEDGAGTLLAETRTCYDHLPEGQVGAQGLVTARAALAITDEAAAEVYGTAAPDFAALGYTRRAGSPGWWVELGRYTRTVDSAGIHGTITGPRGGVFSLDLDPSGCYPVRARDTLGHELTAAFDLRSYQPTSVTDPSGATSAAGFDALARLSFVAEPGDSAAEPTVRYAYDTSALPVVVTLSRRADATGPRMEQREILDGEGRLLERRRLGESGETIETTHAFGPRGLLVRTYLPRPATSASFAPPAPGTPHARLAYDALGRVVRTTRPDGAVASVRYLPGAIEEWDEEDTRTDDDAPHAGTFTRRVLDATGRVVRTEQRLGARVVVTTDAFDAKGSVLEHVDATGAATRFTYDLLGRVLRVRRPEASHVNVLDASGNAVESRSGSAVVLRAFDLADRPVSVRHGSAATAPVVSYTYHDPGVPPAEAGTGTAGGRLVRVDDEAGTTTFDYDVRGRIARKTMRPNGAPVTTLEMTYRSDGLIDTITYPGGTSIGYSYDRQGRLTAVSGVVAEIRYDDAGRRTLTRYANGTEQVEEHDQGTGWRTSTRLSAPGGPLRDLRYRHDLVGNLLEITGPDPATHWAYRYDDAYRLTDATGAGGTWTYAYDDAGNLTSSSDLGGFAYGGGGAPSTCLTAAGADTFAYDDRGQVTSAPWGTHQLDAEGRLRRIDLAAGGHEELTYGHQGALVRRRRVAPDGAVTETISPDRLVRFEDGVLVLQLTDGERVVARESGGARTWLHTDHLGSLVLVTDAAGTVLLDVTYGPYGTVLTRNGVAVPQGFATGEAMAADLVLLGVRWYCPRIGRFLSPDAVVGDAADPLAWNAYAYARCNPTSFVDPTGRSFWKIFGAVLATIAIVALVVIVSVVTFGVASPGAVALGVGGITVTWGAVFAATMIGVVAGGVIGGIAAARAGGDAGDVLLGVLVGGAVGGWAAFGAAFAGVAVAGGLGLTAGSVGAGAVAGGVSGAINGAAMGFASGFAGGRNNGLKDIMEKVLVGAIIGAAIGAALGALSGIQAPKETPRESIEKALRPDVPSAPPAGAPPAPSAPTPPVNSIGDAAAQVGKGVLGKVGGALVPHAAAATSGFTGSIITQTVLVDLSAAAAAGFWDDIQEYVRTHQIDLGPFDFIKGDF